MLIEKRVVRLEIVYSYLSFRSLSNLQNKSSKVTILLLNIIERKYENEIE